MGNIPKPNPKITFTRASRLGDRAEHCLLIAEANQEAILLLTKGMVNAGIIERIYIANNRSEVIQYVIGEGRFLDRSRYPLPTIFLIDLQIGAQDGFSLIWWLRRRSEFKRNLIFGISDRLNGASVQRAMQMGASGCLTLPNNVEDFTRFLTVIATVDLKTISRSPWFRKDQ